MNGKAANVDDTYVDAAGLLYLKLSSAQLWHAQHYVESVAMISKL
jgi:hypothetical protein